MSLLSSPLTAEIINGELSVGDPTLSSGEYIDTYKFEGKAGQTVVIDLQADGFDPYLILRSPSGEQTENDDWEGSSTHARMELTLTENGNHRVTVTSFKKGDTGTYRLQIPGGEDAPRNQTVTGTLAAGDATLSTGEYGDAYAFEGVAGQTVVIDLRSTEFDPYLILRTPSGETQFNDDWNSSSQQSRIELNLPETGHYSITVTSFKSGETGSYQLEYPSGGNTPPSRTITGTLAAGDNTLSSGEYLDLYGFDGVAGQAVVIDLHSTEFDPYISLKTPSGATEFNDDWNGSSQQSRIELSLPETGHYTITVTSYKPGESGAYQLEYPSNAGSSAAGPSQFPSVRRETGSLQNGDTTLASGEFSDSYTFSGQAGDHVVIDLRSDTFDPYLMLRGPKDFKQDNDDHEGSSSWSRIVAELPVDGEYWIAATTYKAGSSGDYELVITQQRKNSSGPTQRIQEGTLAKGDLVLSGGELADKFPLQAVPGTLIVLDLTSSKFDPYIALRAPSGATVFNDDYEGSASRSRVEHVAEEAGEYSIFVTSYKADMTGEYRLSIETSTDASRGDESEQDLISIAAGETQHGNLAEGDLTLDSGEFADIYAFEGRSGQTIAVEMKASQLDTYLLIITPDGESVQNDDFEGNSHRSRIELPLEQDGRYRIVATSYAAAQTGNYTVSVERVARESARPQLALNDGKIFGIFVGVSDYGGRANNLAYTDIDARRSYQAMIDGAGMPTNQGTLLIDSDATRGNFKAAIQRISRQATEHDTVVLFFSGHGGRYDRPTGFDHSDPDGKDESLEFYDGEILDDDLNRLLGTIHAGTQLIVVDACFSGGLAKDIISEPGRMGMFSSEEDVTSAVAAKFRAGGYLSVFFSDCLTEPYADSNEDGELSALEMSHYISERYRAQVKSSGDSDWVSTGQNLGYQKLVVDRGSIRPYDMIFRRK